MPVMLKGTREQERCPDATQLSPNIKRRVMRTLSRIMVLFFTPSVKQSGPVAGVTLLMLIGVDSPRSLRLFHLSPVVKRLQAVPQPPVANVSGQVMKQCSVFISVR